jgi:hypothetical protein
MIDLHISVTRHPNLWALEHLWRWACEFCATCGFTVNFLPSSKRFYRYPDLQKQYEKLIVIWAFFGLNLRKKMPSAEVLEADPLDHDTEPSIVFREPAEHA